MTELVKVLNPHILRRKKKDVNLELPEMVNYLVLIYFWDFVRFLKNFWNFLRFFGIFVIIIIL